MRWFHSSILGLVLAFSVHLPLAWSGEPNPLLSKIQWPTFLAKLDKQNPRIQALTSKIEAEKSQLSLELPAPFLGISSMGANSPVSNIMERTVEFSQKVPFPSKFFKASSVKSAKINSAENEAILSIQKLNTEGADLFIALSQSLQEQELLQEKKKVFKAHLKRLKSLSLSDQIQRIHILEINAEIKSTDMELVESKQREQSARIKIAALLNEEQPFASDPSFEPLPAPESLDSRVKNSTLIARGESQEKLLDSEKSMTTQEWMPDLVLTYRRRVRLDNVMPSSHEVMIGLELPFLWGWQPSQKNEAATFARDESHFEKVNAELNSKGEIQILKDQLKTLWERISLLSNDILPIENERVHLLHSITPSDMESLALHKSVLEKWLADRMKLLDLQSSYRRSYLKLEVMTAVDNNGEKAGSL